MAKGMIRYWAAARAAAGAAAEPYDALTLADALGGAKARHPDPDFARVLSRSSFRVNSEPVGTRPHEEVELPEGATVEVLPPFAGG
jgi:sulfur-carrier protein